MQKDENALLIGNNKKTQFFQGYRDASCLFVERLVNKESIGSHERVKSNYCLCLAIHAPRKGIVEVIKKNLNDFFFKY